MYILVINPGSTSTKVTLFENTVRLFEESPFHDAPELLKYPTVNDQLPFRKQVVLDILKRHGYAPEQVDVFVGRGGSACSQHAGVTVITDKLYADTAKAKGGCEHPAKLGVMLAYELAGQFGKKMFTLNPTNVDEFNDYARLTGIEGVYREAQAHVLNQKAVARTEAEKMGRKYEECNFIVCHIDGGITIHAHEHGKMVDGNCGGSGDGPYTPTRIGSVPVVALLNYLEKHSAEEVRKLCIRSGGFVNYFGTSDSDAVHALVQKGDKKATLVWNGMIYGICKEIGAMAAVLCGKVDRIILTGGLLRFPEIEEQIAQRCGFIAPIATYPGELEQEEMATRVYRVLQGLESTTEYSGEPVWKGFDFETNHRES